MTVPNGYETFCISGNLPRNYEAFQGRDYSIYADLKDWRLEYEGWYWWPCQPGDLPDGDPVGPFKTEAEAITHCVMACKARHVLEKGRKTLD